MNQTTDGTPTSGFSRTLVGRVLNVMHTRGVVFTLRYALYRLFEWSCERREGLADGVETSSPAPGEAACHPYAPTPYTVLKLIFRNIEIAADRDVFLDFGAGKGRAIISAA